MSITPLIPRPWLMPNLILVLFSHSSAFYVVFVQSYCNIKVHVSQTAGCSFTFLGFWTCIWFLVVDESKEAALIETGRFPFGLPIHESKVMDYCGHTLYYNAAKKQPVWVAELINQDSLKGNYGLHVFTLTYLTFHRITKQHMHIQLKLFLQVEYAKLKKNHLLANIMWHRSFVKWPCLFCCFSWWNNKTQSGTVW